MATSAEVLRILRESGDRWPPPPFRTTTRPGPRSRYLQYRHEVRTLEVTYPDTLRPGQTSAEREARTITLDPGLLFDQATIYELSEDVVNNNQGWHPLTNWKFACVLAVMMSECRAGWVDGGSLSEHLRRMFRYDVTGPMGRTDMAPLTYSHLDGLPGFQWVCDTAHVGSFHGSPYGVRFDWRGGRAAVTDCIARRLQLACVLPEEVPNNQLSPYYQWGHDGAGRVTDTHRLVREARRCTLGDKDCSIVGEHRDDVGKTRNCGGALTSVPMTAAYPVGCVEPCRPLLFEVMTTYTHADVIQSRWQYVAHGARHVSPSFRYAYFCPDRPSRRFAAEFGSADFEDFRTMLESPALDGPHLAALTDWLLERDFDQTTADNFHVPGYVRLFKAYGLAAMCGGDL